jgi:hypothetical protein
MNENNNLKVINKKFKKGDIRLTISYIQNYILEFIDCDDLLNKRISKAFNLNTFLYNFTTKEDVRSEVIVKMLSAPVIEKFVWMNGEERLRYFNTVVSNVLFTTFRDAKLSSTPVDIHLDYNFVPT